MAKLKLGPIVDDRPVKITVELKLIVPMLERFIATDRGFAKARRSAG